MSGVTAVAGAITALAALVVPVFHYWKGKTYDKAIRDYKAALAKRDNANNSDDLHYWDGVCKDTSRTAHSLYPLRAPVDLGRA